MALSPTCCLLVSRTNCNGCIALNVRALGRTDVPGHVFISYSSHDRWYVERLADYLGEQGVPVWFDSALEAGDRFEPVIRRKLAESAALLVVLTPASAASPWVNGEVLQCVDADKTIVPVLLSPCEVPLPLRDRHREDCVGGLMPRAQCLAKLRDLCGVKLDESVEAEPAAAKANVFQTRPTQPPFTEVWPPVVTRAPLRVALSGHEKPVYCIAIAPDGTWFATAGEDAVIRI